MNDLNILEELQQEIGETIPLVEEIEPYSIGYTINDKQEITGIGLYSFDLKSVPKSICKLNSLKQLSLDCNQISKLEGLDKLVNLTQLWLDSNKISKIEGLDRLVNLTQLSLSSNQISKIEGLDKLVNLTLLILSSNQISKIKGLDKLVNLTLLWLDSNKISKIEGLDKLVNLTLLRLSSNKISKVEGLDKLVNLTQLWLDNNQISKIEGLDKLVNLTELILTSNQISKIEGLDKLVNLTLLWLDSNKISKIEGLDKLVNLTQLSLDSNQISKIEGLDKLVNLTQLSLSRNQISKIEGLDKLVNLTELSLYSNQISKIEGLDKLVNLTQLSLYSNQISKIEGLDKLVNLTELSLYSNQISKIEGLDKLVNLTQLSLYSNQISKIEGLDKLVNLTELILYSNQISEIEGLDKLVNLTELSLYRNKISKIEGLDKLVNLTQLRLYSNQISKIEGLDKLVNLTLLSLYSNKISIIEGLDKLVNLTQLSLSSNQISKIEGLDKLVNLTLLILSSNQISKIEGLDKLVNLTELSLYSNQISKIEGLDKLVNLTELRLYSNQISKIEGLDKLVNLTQLSLSRNQITTAPPPLLHHCRANGYAMDLLAEANLNENPLIKPPLDVISKGHDAIVRFFKQIEEQGLENIYQGKLMLVGEPESGKTTLMNLLFDRTWKVPQKQDSTVGIEIRTDYKFPFSEEKNIEFNARIWDFGGQHIQYTLHQFFLTRNCVYAVLVNDRKEHHHLEYWFNIIKLLGTGSPVLVILNEKDKKRVSSFDEQLYRDHFPEIDFKSFPVDLGQLDDGRLDVIEHNLQKHLSNLPIVKEQVPALWSTVSEKLGELKERKYIPISEYHQICKDVGVKEEYRMDILRHFHTLGIVLYFEGDFGLKQHVFLDPNWVAGSIYEILNDADKESEDGIFSKKWLFDQWGNRKLKTEEKEMLLQLMKQNNFDLCFPVCNGDSFLAPVLLNKVRPDLNWNFSDNLSFRFQYPFMPAGIVSRFIVRHHNILKDCFVWNKGAILKKDGMEALVVEEKSDKGNHVINIRINGEKSERKEFLYLIRDSIGSIHDDAFPEIEFEQEIPCICPQCLDAKHPHYFAYQTIKTFIEKGRHAAICDKSAEDVPIAKLVGASLVENKDFVEENGQMQLTKREIHIHNHIPQPERIPESHITSTDIEKKWYDFVLKVLKILFGTSHVKVTLAILAIAALLMPTPWWQPVVYTVFDVPKDQQPSDQWTLSIGIGLVVIAVIYDFGTRYMEKKKSSQ